MLIKRLADHNQDRRRDQGLNPYGRKDERYLWRHRRAPQGDHEPDVENG